MIDITAGTASLSYLLLLCLPSQANGRAKPRNTHRKFRYFYPRGIPVKRLIQYPRYPAYTVEDRRFLWDIRWDVRWESHGFPWDLAGYHVNPKKVPQEPSQKDYPGTRFSLRAKGTSQRRAEYEAAGKPSCRSPVHRFGCRGVCERALRRRIFDPGSSEYFMELVTSGRSTISSSESAQPGRSSERE